MVQLPQNARRVADAFTGLSEADKSRIIGHLEAQPDPGALEKTITQILRNGGQEAELVGRIFQRNVNPAEGSDQPRPGIRTVDNKPLEPIQKKDAGTGAAGAGELETELPHTSTVVPPALGHEGRTVAQPGGSGKAQPVVSDSAREVRPGGDQPTSRPQSPTVTSTKPASGNPDQDNV
jgi:hypothetical protein